MTPKRYPAAILFDLDGVIIDTESQYDVFWRRIGEEHALGIPNLEKAVKGSTLPDILSRYFSHWPEDKRQQLIDDNHDFELSMTFDYIPGAFSFLQVVKKEGIKTALVTSSDNVKLKEVFERLQLAPFFDTIVSADRITEGKPHPMCYLLAAADLGVLPGECVVFEDSFQGIEAGNRAGMKVVGLSTTHPKEAIEEKVWKVIPHFEGFSIDQLS